MFKKLSVQVDLVVGIKVFSRAKQRERKANYDINVECRLRVNEQLVYEDAASVQAHHSPCIVVAAQLYAKNTRVIPAVAGISIRGAYN